MAIAEFGRPCRQGRRGHSRAHRRRARGDRRGDFRQDWPPVIRSLLDQARRRSRSFDRRPGPRQNRAQGGDAQHRRGDGCVARPVQRRICMPSDILGSEVMEEAHVDGRRAFRFIKGPIFAQLLMADEINLREPGAPSRRSSRRCRSITSRSRRGGAICRLPSMCWRPRTCWNRKAHAYPRPRRLLGIGF